MGRLRARKCRAAAEQEKIKMNQFLVEIEKMQNDILKIQVQCQLVDKGKMEDLSL